MIENKKHTGAYYTPDYLANFISNRVLSYFNGASQISLLEPSVGDGSFVSELNNSNVNISLTAVDINKNELKNAKAKWSGSNSRFINSDFLEYNTQKKFSVVIGNPPYVKKNLLSKRQLKIIKNIHINEGVSEFSAKNIWTSFLIKGNMLLADNGVLAYVLPSELLQVKFAEEIREYLRTQFQRIEIFTFNDLMFECKEQDTIVLIAYKKHIQPGDFFSNIKNSIELKEETFILNENSLLVESKVKWTHHFLTNEEITFLNQLKDILFKIDFYSNSKPGIVTAANNFFIIDRKIEQDYNLSKYTIPVIQKGLFVNGGVEFNPKDYDLIEQKYPSRLLQINDNDEITDELREYLQKGIEFGIPNRYKCKKRKNWYVIPNIATKPSAFFFKRCHHYPKLLKNNTSSFVTDSAYKVDMRDEYDLHSFIFSFYNSMTLAFAEIDGRYYGGGVLELTPSEFKNLPLPYFKITKQEFKEFARRFEKKKNIDAILVDNDKKILGDVLNLEDKEIKRIQQIRQKLINKRLR